MSCCGGRRQQWSAANLTPTDASAMFRPIAATAMVLFEYTGTTGLTATGPVTGTRYRFNRPEARVAVDGRDASGMAAVPVLRRLRLEEPAN